MSGGKPALTGSLHESTRNQRSKKLSQIVYFYNFGEQPRASQVNYLFLCKAKTRPSPVFNRHGLPLRIDCRRDGNPRFGSAFPRAGKHQQLLSCERPQLSESCVRDVASRTRKNTNTRKSWYLLLLARFLARYRAECKRETWSLFARRAVLSD